MIEITSSGLLLLGAALQLALAPSGYVPHQRLGIAVVVQRIYLGTLTAFLCELTAANEALRA